LQRIQKQFRLALTECVHRIRALRIMFRSLREVYAPGGEKASNAVGARSPINIVEVVSCDIERLKGQSTLLRPPLQERVKNRFPRSRVDASSVGQHTVEIEDRGVEVASAYRDLIQ
jgi:hypothetical protein